MLTVSIVKESNHIYKNLFYFFHYKPCYIAADESFIKLLR